MALPETIGLDPLTALPQVELVVPGSKSITNRALILAALGSGETVLNGALWSEDTHVMVSCLRQLGVEIEVAPEEREASNRSLRVVGSGGRLAKGGSVAEPLDLFVGNAGTAARFLMALVCLGQGVYRLRGVNRMHERPQAGLVAALRQLGYRVESENDRLPLLVHGAGPRSAACEVDITASSQFASALLLVAEAGGWEIRCVGAGLDHAPYVTMTQELIRAFPANGGTFQVEPDASSGSYLWALNGLGLPSSAGEREGFPVRVADWPQTGWQIDAAFPQFVASPRHLSRESDLGDSIMTAIVLAALGQEERRFTDLGRLRVQECERVVALRTELTKCGIRVEEEGDMLTVFPGKLQPAVIDTYDDHRIAMCFAVLALAQEGIQLRQPECVKKTFPSFFRKLATAPPHGLGVVVRDASSGHALSPEELQVSC